MLKLTAYAGALVLLGALALPYALDVNAQGRNRDREDKKFRVIRAGKVPNEWGDLHSVVEPNPGSYSLVFKNKEEEIRIIRLSGSKLPDQYVLIEREY